jgi:hypothetical protein
MHEFVRLGVGIIVGDFQGMVTVDRSQTICFLAWHVMVEAIVRGIECSGIQSWS